MSICNNLVKNIIPKEQITLSTIDVTCKPYFEEYLQQIRHNISRYPILYNYETIDINLPNGCKNVIIRGNVTWETLYEYYRLIQVNDLFSMECDNRQFQGEPLWKFSDTALWIDKQFILFRSGLVLRVQN